jgi:integrase
MAATDGEASGLVSRHGTAPGKGISENVVWYVVPKCAQRMQLDHLAPHDLRRICAKLCHVNGGELDQIQFFLGHASALSRMQGESGETGERSVWTLFSRTLDLH